MDLSADFDDIWRGPQLKLYPDHELDKLEDLPDFGIISENAVLFKADPKLEKKGFFSAHRAPLAHAMHAGWITSENLHGMC